MLSTGKARQASRRCKLSHTKGPLDWHEQAHCPVEEGDKREATTSVMDSGIKKEIAELKKLKHSKA